MSKATELISKETVLRCVYGNIKTMLQAKANIYYMIWMHPELEEQIDTNGLLSDLDKLIDRYHDTFAAQMALERDIEDAVIEEYGWH